MGILVINAGSSSLKFGLFDAQANESLVSGLIDWTADPGKADLILRPYDRPEVRSQVSVADHRAAAAQAVRSAAAMAAAPGTGPPTITAVGHRVVHGGEAFRESVRIEAEVKAAIARLAKLAPLH